MSSLGLDIVESPLPSDSGFPQRVVRWDYRSRVDGVADWALLEPHADESTTWAVYIHGHGSRGDQLFIRPDIREVWLPALRSHGMSILAVNLRGNAWMGPAAVRDLHDLLDALRHRRGARRFVFVGGSMGGTSVLAYAARHPEDVAACLAICPATDIARFAAWCEARVGDRPVFKEIHQAILDAYQGTPGLQPDRFAAHSACGNAPRLTMPIAIAHAVGDAIIPVSESRELADRLARHPRFRYIEQPGGGHDSPLPLMPELLDWLMTEAGASDERSR